MFLKLYDLAELINLNSGVLNEWKIVRILRYGNIS